MTAAVAVVDEFHEDRAYEARLRAQVREIIAQSFSPPPKLTVSEWADEYRVLSPEASSEPGAPPKSYSNIPPVGIITRASSPYALYRN